MSERKDGSLGGRRLKNVFIPLSESMVKSPYLSPSSPHQVNFLSPHVSRTRQEVQVEHSKSPCPQGITKNVSAGEPALPMLNLHGLHLEKHIWSASLDDGEGRTTKDSGIKHSENMCLQEPRHCIENTTTLTCDHSSFRQESRIKQNNSYSSVEDSVSSCSIYDLQQCVTDTNSSLRGDGIDSCTCYDTKKYSLETDPSARDMSRLISTKQDSQPVKEVSGTGDSISHQPRDKFSSTSSLNQLLQDQSVLIPNGTGAGDKMKCDAQTKNINLESEVVSPDCSVLFSSQKNLIATTDIHSEHSNDTIDTVNQCDEIKKEYSSHMLQREFQLEKEQRPFGSGFDKTANVECVGSLTHQKDLQGKVDECCQRMRADILLSTPSSESLDSSSNSPGSNMKRGDISPIRSGTNNTPVNTLEDFSATKTHSSLESCSDDSQHDCEDSGYMESECTFMEKHLQNEIMCLKSRLDFVSRLCYLQMKTVINLRSDLRKCILEMRKIGNIHKDDNFFVIRRQHVWRYILYLLVIEVGMFSVMYLKPRNSRLVQKKILNRFSEYVGRISAMAAFIQQIFRN
ncbi:hypothetical protein ScPMuIL_000628 [Solemya velum]